MNPATLILSYGEVTPIEIAKNILIELKQPVESTVGTHDALNVHYYKCSIETKYYSNSIYLIPFEGKCDTVPQDILKSTEALIIYFDPKDKSFLKCLPEINAFFQNNEIQLGFLITTTLTGDKNEISYQELKEKTNFLFDVITLKGDVEDETESDSKNNYTEVIEGLSNFVWSNVNLKSNACSHQRNSSNTEDLEKQLIDFEKLLISAQSLRNGTRLSRDEFLDKAEELAEVMSSILNDNDSD
ncbi:uncharacterized protein LOC115624591 [Scaptodrosophila lebanonensis]|uniref:Uncharacterized protein LOC115624591 n=1 Tax=Drosophila lebanonensis TaxID=7225 RepID=A0A6J2TGQ9_DROLE|nr:uncharacterized protein LOC115624591 [Scaptodrosophila lebanonensis]